MATIQGTAGPDSLQGTASDDTMLGLGGNDVVRGWLGDDLLDGGTGDDLLIGRQGNDRYYVDSRADRVIDRPGEGMDTVYSTVSYALSLRQDTENLILQGNAKQGTGNLLDNRITVADPNGYDRNLLNGREGADLMAGGNGNDRYYVDNANDVIHEFGIGDDSVFSTATYVFKGDLDPSPADAYIERLFLIGSANIDAIGDSFGNLMLGNDGNNVLRGMIGDDVLHGGAGSDSIYGGQNLDRLTGGAGADGFYMDELYFNVLFFDTITDFTSGDDTIFLDRSKYTEISAGTLSQDAFVVGTEAQDAEDRIIYDAETGKIFYDPDGTGAHEMTFSPLVIVTPGTTVEVSDFIGYGG